MRTELEDPQKAKDHAVCMAYDAFSLCLGHKPANSSTTVMDVVRWLECVWSINIFEVLRKSVTTPAPISPHEYKAHKKYPWFCGECGYPPHDEVKHIQNPEFTPAVFLNTCGCEPMTNETAEAVKAMVECSLPLLK